MTTAEKIRAIRKTLKLTQAKFAEDLKVSSSYVSEIEKGNKHPSNTLISLLRVTYGINPLWWETGDGQMFAEIDHIRPKSKIKAEDFENVILVDEPELSLHHEMFLKLFDAVDTETQDEVLNLLLKKVRESKKDTKKRLAKR